MMKYIIIFILGLVLMSCNSEVTKSMTQKPTAMGRINQVMMIADEKYHIGEVADSLLYYFESAYPILPAAEPIFDVRFQTPKGLMTKPYSKELRVFVVVADLSDEASVTTKMVKEDFGSEKIQKAMTDPDFNTLIGNDKWAKGQIIIYLFAKNKPLLFKAIRENFPVIAKKINQHDFNNLSATVYGLQNDNVTLSSLVLENFGLNIKIPGLYQKALEKENFLWLRMDTKKSIQSLIFRKFSYTNKNIFDMENIIKMRNEYGKQFISTMFDDAYMSTNVIDLPAYEYAYIHNQIYTKEVRGIWETVNDFKGGPFISYLLHNEAKNEVVFIDAFLFAPGEDKRDLMQQLDCIVKTASFPGIIKN